MMKAAASSENMTFVVHCMACIQRNSNLQSWQYLWMGWRNLKILELNKTQYEFEVLERLYKNMCYSSLYIKPLAVQIVTPSIEPVKSIGNSRDAGL